MKFIEQVKKLQKKNEGHIILVRCGIFFNCIGKDAVFMQEKFGLGTICAKPKMCKNGIPVTSIQKFIPKLKESGYSYKIYNYEKEKKEIKEVCRIDGKLIEEIRECTNCEECIQNKRTIENNINYLNEIKKGRIIL